MDILTPFGRQLQTTFALWAVVFLAAAWIAYCRCKKRGEDFAQSVYDLFMADAPGKLPAGKSA